MTGPLSDKSQEGKILRLLRERKDWVSALELSRISLQYCRAIRGLRIRGYQIGNFVETVGGVRRGYYRLDADPQAPQPADALAAWERRELLTRNVAVPLFSGVR